MESLIRLPEVQARTGLSRSTIYDRLKFDPSFPRKISLGARAIGFVESEIEEWVQNQIAKSRGTALGYMKKNTTGMNDLSQCTK